MFKDITSYSLDNSGRNIQINIKKDDPEWWVNITNDPVFKKHVKNRGQVEKFENENRSQT